MTKQQRLKLQAAETAERLRITPELIVQAWAADPCRESREEVAHWLAQGERTTDRPYRVSADDHVVDATGGCRVVPGAWEDALRALGPRVERMVRRALAARDRREGRR